jgi:hypothetical protein
MQQSLIKVTAKEGRIFLEDAFPKATHDVRFGPEQATETGHDPIGDLQGEFRLLGTYEARVQLNIPPPRI